MKRFPRFLLLLSLPLFISSSAFAQDDAPLEEEDVAPTPELEEIADVDQAAADLEQPQEETAELTEGESPVADVAEAPLDEPAPTVEALPVQEPPVEVAEELDVADEVGGADAGDDGEKLPWRGSMFIFEQDLSTATFDRSAGITYNPTYVWAFTLMPRWFLTDNIYLRLRQDVDIELTDNDSRTYQNEVWFADTRLDVGHAKLLEFSGATLAGAARIRLPLSKSSQAYNRILGTGFGAALSYPVEGVLEGLGLGAALGYDHYWATSNVTSTDETYPCAPAAAENLVSGRITSSGCSQTGGGSTVSDSITLGFSAEVTPVENFTLGTSFTWWWTRGHGLADAVVPVATAPGGAITLGDGSETHWRNLTWFTFEAGYTFTEWVNAALGFSTLTTQLNPDGTRRNPIANIDSQVYLTANFTLDALFGAVSESSEESAPIAEADEEGAEL